MTFKQAKEHKWEAGEKVFIPLFEDYTKKDYVRMVACTVSKVTYCYESTLTDFSHLSSWTVSFTPVDPLDVADYECLGEHRLAFSDYNVESLDSLVRIFTTKEEADKYDSTRKVAAKNREMKRLKTELSAMENSLSAYKANIVSIQEKIQVIKDKIKAIKST